MSCRSFKGALTGEAAAGYMWSPQLINAPLVTYTTLAALETDQYDVTLEDLTNGTHSCKTMPLADLPTWYNSFLVDGGMLVDVNIFDAPAFPPLGPPAPSNAATVYSWTKYVRVWPAARRDAASR